MVDTWWISLAVEVTEAVVVYALVAVFPKDTVKMVIRGSDLVRIDNKWETIQNILTDSIFVACVRWYVVVEGIRNVRSDWR